MTTFQVFNENYEYLNGYILSNSWTYDTESIFYDDNLYVIFWCKQVQTAHHKFLIKSIDL